MNRHVGSKGTPSNKERKRAMTARKHARDPPRCGDEVISTLSSDEDVDERARLFKEEQRLAEELEVLEESRRVLLLQ